VQAVGCQKRRRAAALQDRSEIQVIIRDARERLGLRQPSGALEVTGVFSANSIKPRSTTFLVFV